MSGKNEDIFMEAEKHYLQSDENVGFDYHDSILTSDHLLPSLRAPDLMTNNNTESERASFKGYNDGFLHVFSKPDGTQPKWLEIHKVIPGLSGFVVCDDNAMVESDFDKIDVEQLADEKNMNLFRLFEDPEKHAHYGNNNSHFARRKNSSNNAKHLASFKQRGSGGNMGSAIKNEQKISFFKDFIPHLVDSQLNEIGNSNGAEKFSEFMPLVDIAKNLGNFLFLEENKTAYENEFEKVYQKQYEKIIEKLKFTAENYAINSEMLIKVIYEQFTLLMHNLFMTIKNCNSDYCFNLMKNKTNSSKYSKGNNGVLPGSINPLQFGGNTHQQLPIPTINMTALTANMQPNFHSKPQQSNSLLNGLTNLQNQSQLNGFNNLQNQNQLNMPSSQVTNPLSGMTNSQQSHFPSSNSLSPNTGVGMSKHTLSALSQLIDGNLEEKKISNKYSNGQNSIEIEEEYSNTGYSRAETMSMASDLESIISSDKYSDISSSRKTQTQRKYWSEAETREIENLYNQYYPNTIPLDKLEEFAKKNFENFVLGSNKSSKIQKRRSEETRGFSN
jgi:hypothetical protein